MAAETFWHTKGQRLHQRLQHDVTHLQTQPMSLPTFYTLQFPRYSLGQIIKMNITTARSKNKSRSHHDVAHLHPQPMSLPNINFLHITVSKTQPRRHLKVKVTIEKIKSKLHHYTVHLHLPTNFSIKYQHPTLHGLGRYSLDKTFSYAHTPAHLDNIGKTKPAQP